jgi:hypothetical protein
VRLPPCLPALPALPARRVVAAPARLPPVVVSRAGHTRGGHCARPPRPAVLALAAFAPAPSSSLGPGADVCRPPLHTCTWQVIVRRQRGRRAAVLCGACLLGVEQRRHVTVSEWCAALHACGRWGPFFCSTTNPSCAHRSSCVRAAHMLLNYHTHTEQPHRLTSHAVDPCCCCLLRGLAP